MRGVKKETVSTRDVLRAWVVSHGDSPVDGARAKLYYDLHSLQADPKWTMTEVRRVLSETHELCTDGLWRSSVAVRVGGHAVQSVDVADRSGAHDLSSWDHPILSAALEALNARSDGEPIRIDFMDSRWMDIYNETQYEMLANQNAGPLDCAITVIARLLNGRS